jgi:hypothetical protein
LQEQQESIRLKKEEAERQRKRQEESKRIEREEEEALGKHFGDEFSQNLIVNDEFSFISEQARQAMMLKDPSRPAVTNANHFRNSAAPTGPGPDAMSAVPEEPDPAEKARLERERQRQREQERRRREAKANQIDMNMQSDLLAAFEDTIT